MIHRKQLSIEQAIERGYTLQDYQIQQRNDKYSVTMVKDNERKTFGNVSKERLDDILPPRYGCMKEKSLDYHIHSVEQAIERGYVVEDHRKNGRMHSVKMTKGTQKKTFTNISQDHLNLILGE
jgi:hypothetical protein